MNNKFLAYFPQEDEQGGTAPYGFRSVLYRRVEKRGMDTVQILGFDCGYKEPHGPGLNAFNRAVEKIPHHAKDVILQTVRNAIKDQWGYKGEITFLQNDAVEGTLIAP